MKKSTLEEQKNIFFCAVMSLDLKKGKLNLQFIVAEASEKHQTAQERLWMLSDHSRAETISPIID